MKSLFARLFGQNQNTDSNDSLSKVEAVSSSSSAFNHFLTLPEKDLNVVESVYPPPDAPLLALDAETVLQTQSKLIRELMWAVSMDIEDKNRYLLPVIQNLAAFVHLLPASQSHHHNGRGGLFRHSLETAFYAVNIAKNRLLDVNANPADTYHNQSRWFLAIAIAGLMHDVGKCLTDMTVTAPEAEKAWLPTVESLSDWLEKHRLQHFYCTWNLNRIHRQHECAGAVLYPILVPMETRRYLEESFSTKLKNELFEALVGIRREGGEIAAAVLRADVISTKKDIARQLQDGFHPGVNAPIVVWLEKIMQELVENGTWKVNALDSPLWVTPKGVFLVWHRAVRAIQEQLRKGQYPTMPTDPMIWEDKFKESSLVESRFLDFEEDMGMNVRETHWRLLPLPELIHDAKSDHLNFLTAYKLTENSLLFANIGQPAPVTVFLEGEPLTDEEKTLWMATSDHPMTAFASSQAFHHTQAPKYTEEEVADILHATYATIPDKDPKDFFIPDEAGFTAIYPDVSVEALLNKQPPPQEDKQEEATEESSHGDQRPITPPFTEADLLSPSQKKAKAEALAKKQKKEDVKEDSDPVHAHTHTHTVTHTHTYKDKSPEPESSPVPEKQGTSRKKAKCDENKKSTMPTSERNRYLNELMAEIKIQLQEGKGSLIENLLYRDDCIYGALMPIERVLREKGIALTSFIDRLQGFQVPPILNVTDDQLYVFIEKEKQE